MLVKTWSDQKAFTDCLVEMTDCDHFYNPIGYDTVLVTDPCMSAKYDFLTHGLNQQVGLGRLPCVDSLVPKWPPMDIVCV